MASLTLGTTQLVARSLVAGGSASSTGSTSRSIFTLLAQRQQQQQRAAFSVTARSRYATSNMRSSDSPHTAGESPEGTLAGSAAKADRSNPGSLVGGRVGVIAPSQAMTDDFTINRAYPDYSKGPSALDKASKLFFFSEILRGMWVV